MRPIILVDTGPLVALINRNAPHHSSCATALGHLPKAPLLTTWCCFTEAMYLLGKAGGYPAQEELWSFVADGLITIHTTSSVEQDRMRVLMAKFRDTPMDLADASIVAAAEHLALRRIFYRG